jgi:hypothetical protein
MRRSPSQHESERHLIARKVAADANAWADKLRADAAKRAPAVPAPVAIKGAKP